MTRAPGAADRQRDLIALALVLAGASLFIYAFTGMLSLPRTPQAEGALPFALLGRWQSLRRIAWYGGALVAAGIAVAVWANLRLRRPASTA